jgi:hypothetical protein
MSSVCGVIRRWTIPVREGDGFMSVLSLSCCDAEQVGHVGALSLSVTLELQEDHGGWCVGQHVVAHNVEFESPWKGTTHKCLATKGENIVVEQQQGQLSFVDLAVDKIVGFNKRDGFLFVRLQSFVDAIVCVDEAKSAEILDIGVGGLVQFFNLKLRVGGLCISKQSGVRRIDPDVVERPLPPVNPAPATPIVTNNHKWQCIVCAHVNYPSKSVCYMCDNQRKVGPMFKDLRHYPLQKSAGKKKFIRR